MVFLPFLFAKTAFWLRISMDRISDSDSEDAGSIPAGATTKQTLKQTLQGFYFV